MPLRELPSSFSKFTSLFTPLTSSAHRLKSTSWREGLSLEANVKQHSATAKKQKRGDALYKSVFSFDLVVKECWPFSNYNAHFADSFFTSFHVLASPAKFIYLMRATEILGPNVLCSPVLILFHRDNDPRLKARVCPAWDHMSAMWASSASTALRTKP